MNKWAQLLWSELNNVFIYLHSLYHAAFCLWKIQYWYFQYCIHTLFSLFQHKKGGDFSSVKVYTLFLMKNCYYERKKFYKNMNKVWIAINSFYTTYYETILTSAVKKKYSKTLRKWMDMNINITRTLSLEASPKLGYDQWFEHKPKTSDLSNSPHWVYLWPGI